MNAFFYFLIPFLIGVVVTPFLKMISERSGKFIDIAEGDSLKIHKKSVSLFGGTTMMICILCAFLFLEETSFYKAVAVAICCLVVFLLGLWDDIKWKHSSKAKPFLKFLFLLLVTLVSSLILNFNAIGFNFIPYSVISILLGFIYIFVVINAVNYQDGADGLAGGLTAISFLGFIVLSVVLNNSFALWMSLISFGSVLAFLIFNFPPAKIFMGDSGAYLLGFNLALLAFIFSSPYNFFSVVGAIFIIGLPVFDGVFTNMRRVFSGKSIFHGDREHFYDKLMKRLSIKKTLLISYALQAILVILGLIIYSYA